MAAGWVFSFARGAHGGRIDTERIAILSDTQPDVLLASPLQRHNCQRWASFFFNLVLKSKLIAIKCPVGQLLFFLLRPQRERNALIKRENTKLGIGFSDRKAKAKLRIFMVRLFWLRGEECAYFSGIPSEHLFSTSQLRHAALAALSVAIG